MGYTRCVEIGVDSWDRILIQDHCNECQIRLKRSVSYHKQKHSKHPRWYGLREAFLSIRLTAHIWKSAILTCIFSYTMADCLVGWLVGWLVQWILKIINWTPTEYVIGKNCIECVDISINILFVWQKYRHIYVFIKLFRFQKQFFLLYCFV